MSLSPELQKYLLELQKLYREYLFQDFLPYMDAHIVDKKQGGFLCHTDRKGYNVSTHKRTWYDGRGIWVYSFLYKNFKKDTTYLDIARKTIDLLWKVKPENNDFWPISYTREGLVLPDKQKDIYGGLFVAEGLTAYSLASGDTSFLSKAKEILFAAMDRYDAENYCYKPHYDSKGMEIKAPRVLGHWMVLLNVSGQILEQSYDPEIEEISNRCINALLKHHLQPGFELMIEYLNHDFSPHKKYAQFSYIGHAIETLWMLMKEAQRRKDENLFAEAASLFQRHVEVAWDDVYGGVFHCLKSVDENDWLLDKVLWAQEEIMVGLMILIEKENNLWAQQWLPKVWQYLQDHFILKNHPSKLWINGGNRKLDKHHQKDRFENYHHPRHLMHNLLKLEEIMERIEV